MLRRRRPPRPGALADLSPVRIARQIITLQVSYYATALILITFASLSAGAHMNLDRILAWQNLPGDNTQGWMYGLCWILTSLISVVYLLLLIARSKLIPDFAITIHLLNLIATSLYSKSIPTYTFWWLVQLASIAVMTSLGIWSCRWRELQPINFGGIGSMDDSLVEDGLMDAHGNDGASYAHGRPQGKGRDGATAYEMVTMKEREEDAS